ncbi:MAG TPA: RNA methyltransferase, partial [Nocardioidaceae bacterium]|nr:RNA methyltransferase [Nocardioidaceae bacterium]
MAELIEVSDASDPRLADYVSLRDVQLRQSLEAEHGFFIAEGEKVVRRAVAAGYKPRSFLMSRRWLDGLRDELHSAADVPCYVVTDDLAEEVTGFHVHRGALASVRRRPLPSVDAVVAGARRVAVLEDIVDHANVGAVIRCAAALGVDGVLLSPRCADPLYRRSVKVAMGTVFSVPWTRVDDWYDTLPRLADHGFTTVALTPDSEAESLADLAAWAAAATPPARLAIVVGSEGPGLTPRWLSTAQRRVRIEMATGVDSLNVAAAAAIA